MKRLFKVKVVYQSGLNTVTRFVFAYAETKWEAIERVYSLGNINGVPARKVQPDRSKYSASKVRSHYQHLAC